MVTKKQILLLLSFVLCLSTFAQKVDNVKQTTSFKQKDTAYWVYNFREFRDAIFQHDKEKAKAFFSFPVKNESNEIWYVAYEQDERSLDRLPGTGKPFTEADFDKYFDRIFSKNFLKAILKIKTDELYKKGAYETIQLKDSSTTYMLYAGFDRKKNLLELNFASKTEYKSEEGIDNAEFNIIYYFEITAKGHVMFKQIRIAG